MHHNKLYDEAFIRSALESTELGAFSTIKDGSIISRFMLFACDPGLRFCYLLTHGSTEKLSQLSANPSATLGVLIGAQGELEDMAEVTLVGRAEASDEFGSPWVQEGLRLLGVKSPMVLQLAASGSMNGYRMIRLHMGELVFRTYRDVVQNVPKTVLRLAS